MSSDLFSILAAAKPAGGAAVNQILIANAMAITASATLYWLVMGHRTGRRTHLARAAAFAERRSGLPGWAALPLGVAMVSLLVALLGMYWDISLHIDQGRDPGPLANPAHYLILSGLFGIFSAGFIAMALPKEQVSDTALRINRGWYASLGGALMMATSGFALLGFPLDDIWHRLFGQDVTLWGPTHLMLFGGAGLTLIGMIVLITEGIRSRPDARAARGTRGFVTKSMATGGLLIGLSTFQGEFDFGVPQFQMVFQPMLIALAAAVALVCARLWIGRGGALAAASFFILVRGAVTLIVHQVFGETTPAMPLYLAEAACVEVAALAFARRPLLLGIVAGASIGTVGFAAEYGWTHLVYTLPWNSHLLPEGLIVATIAGVAGGTLGALMGMALRGELPGVRVARTAALVSAAGDRGPDRERADHERPAGIRRQGAADRHPPRAPARGLGAGTDPPRRRRDRRQVAERDLLAGRRARGRPPAPGRERPLPDHRTDPGARRLEGHAAAADRAQRPRAADLLPCRPGDSGPQGRRPGALRPPLRQGQAAAPAGDQEGGAELADDGGAASGAGDRAQLADDPQLRPRPHRPSGPPSRAGATSTGEAGAAAGAARPA